MLIGANEVEGALSGEGSQKQQEQWIGGTDAYEPCQSDRMVVVTKGACRSSRRHWKGEGMAEQEDAGGKGQQGRWKMVTGGIAAVQ